MSKFYNFIKYGCISLQFKSGRFEIKTKQKKTRFEFVRVRIKNVVEM